MKRLLLTLALICAALPAAAQTDPVFGLWRIESGKAIVEVAPCDGASACGSVVWLAEPRLPSGAPKVDALNNDRALRSRPICGMDMIGGFSRNSPGDWSGGWIYNPNNGKTYTAFMEMRRNGTLKVRGYVGSPLFGRSQIWTRMATNMGGC